MFIQTEDTPNPETIKFLPGKEVMSKGTAEFKSIESAINSPLASRIFDVEGVNGVFLGSDFISVTKSKNLNKFNGFIALGCVIKVVSYTHLTLPTKA